MSTQLRMAALKKEAEVTKEQACNALRHMRRQGYQNVDSKNKEHQQAYITLRDTHERVDGEQLENYLESLTTNVATGAESIQEYWGVPKANWASLADMPAEVRERKMP